MGSSTTRAVASGRSTTSSRTAPARPIVDWFYIDEERSRPAAAAPYPTDAIATAGRAIRPPAPARRRVPAPARLPGVVGPAGAAQAQHRQPGMREHLLGVAEHWLRFGIDGWRLDVAEEIDAGFWREFRRALPRGQPGRLHRRRDLARKPGLAARATRFDALMNYPLAEAILGVRRRAPPRHGRRRDAARVPQHVRPIDGVEFAAALERADAALYDRDVTAASSTCWAATTRPRFLTRRRRRQGRAAPGHRCSR